MVGGDGGRRSDRCGGAELGREAFGQVPQDAGGRGLRAGRDDVELQDGPVGAALLRLRLRPVRAPVDREAGGQRGELQRAGCLRLLQDGGDDLGLEVRDVSELVVEDPVAVGPDLLDELQLLGLGCHACLAHHQARDALRAGGDVLLGGRAQAGLGEGVGRTAPRAAASRRRRTARLPGMPRATAPAGR